MYDMIAGTNK